MTNIYAKTVHKKYSTPHEFTQLHQLEGLRERWKLPSGVRAEPRKL